MLRSFSFLYTILLFEGLQILFFVMVDDWVDDLKGMKLYGSPLLIYARISN
jgi:hypothetical protein